MTDEPGPEAAAPGAGRNARGPGVPAAAPGRPRPLPASPRETPANRREWDRMREHTRVATMWGVPFRIFLVAVVLGLLVPFLDRTLAPVIPAELDTGTVASVLSIISGAMVTLAGLVFTALATVMSLGVTSLSVRIAPLLQGDRVIQWGLGAFTGTFVFSLLIVVSIATAGPGYQPWLGAALAVLATLACGVMFIAVTVRVTQQLNPAVLLRRMARDGWHATRYDPARFHTHADVVATRSVPDGHEVRRHLPVTHGDTLLAVNTPRLLDCEDAWDMRIELVPRVGTPVPHGGLLFRTSAPTTADQAARLERTVAFGDLLSPDSGPFGAIRAMVDIALKALSPAVNDPTRAVQALDQIEDVLVRLSPRVAARERELEGHPNAAVLRNWGHGWEDCVAAASDEIRQFGTTSVQIQRRLRAMFTTLLSRCPPEQHPPLQQRLEALTRGVDTWWQDPLDRRLSAGTDAQGLGQVEAPRAAEGHERNIPPAPQVRTTGTSTSGGERPGTGEPTT